jgi:hypothetical protein
MSVSGSTATASWAKRPMLLIGTAALKPRESAGVSNT